jgi:hypothetical protein
VFPLVVMLGLTVLVKAGFNLHRSRSQDRKDFLELWTKQVPDNLWLEVAIRHQFGAYLPASLIRSLQRHPQAGRALLEVASCWDLLDMDDATGAIQWRAKRHERPVRRKWERWVSLASYFVFAFAGLTLAYTRVVATDGNASSSWLLWIFCAFLLGIAFSCLTYHETLGAAERSMTRWLGIEPMPGSNRDSSSPAKGHWNSRAEPRAKANVPLA